jgi:hypothetical protein
MGADAKAREQVAPHDLLAPRSTRPVAGSARARGRQTSQTIVTPFVRLNVDDVQNAAALRYQTW